jgi:hypothetical protein
MGEVANTPIPWIGLGFNCVATSSIPNPPKSGASYFRSLRGCSRFIAKLPPDLTMQGRLNRSGYLSD